ncbi:MULTISPECIES: HlyD family type I secretion periplasmic adaptor subunit [Enterobacter cloacae complex]|uniref:Membrane fusion protein (MFP) family protein n=1 Tax=Enterobacter genomosp. O TaxID=2364150 RepID=A0A0X4EX72_9ENTR|nr:MULTISPECIES: HlyD family type I secretion periplasmic adaptor subunit [Enterobacter cloacae complex]KUQ86316.1 lipase [Enterobacter genomosp. O]MCM7109380.1 HlyD family type I secretion periplasmic adaptor subunit [Enterobacter cloacae]
MHDTDALKTPLVDVIPFVRFGWIVLLAGLGSFLLWAALAPLDKGVVSSGTVVVDGYRKAIQAPIGGVVTKIAVKEGQTVHKGDLLVMLSQQTSLAQLSAARQHYLTSLIAESRLRSELAGMQTLTLPPEAEEEALQDAMKPIVLQQSQLMHARQEALKNAQQNDAQAIAGLARQRDSLARTCETKERGLALVNRQLKDLKPLMEEGYFPRNRFLDIQVQSASLAGEVGETRSKIVELGNQIEQLKRSMQQRLIDNRKDIETQIDQLRLQVSESKKQLTLSDVDLSLTRVVAPQDGVVMNLALASDSAVVSAGEQLLELVPQTSPLTIDSHIDVALIDKVHKGMPVTLMFTAFNQQSTPRIPAQVSLVSADRQTDPTTQQPYYKIQIAVSPEGMKKLESEDIKPGMPVEVFIKAGERSLLSYLLKPIVDRATRSFIEE